MSPRSRAAAKAISPSLRRRFRAKAGHDRPDQPVRPAETFHAMGEHATAGLWRLSGRAGPGLDGLVLRRHAEAEKAVRSEPAPGCHAAELINGSVVILRRHLLAVALRLVVVD